MVQLAIILHAHRLGFNLQYSINWEHMPIIPAVGRHCTDEDTGHGRASIFLYIPRVTQNGPAAIGNNVADAQNNEGRVPTDLDQDC